MPQIGRKNKYTEVPKIDHSKMDAQQIGNVLNPTKYYFTLVRKKYMYNSNCTHYNTLPTL